MMSLAEVALASSIACLSEPAPESAVVVTVMGTIAGVTAEEALETLLVPALFVAVTVNV